MNYAKTSFGTEIFDGAIISVVQYLAPLRYSFAVELPFHDREAQRAHLIVDKTNLRSHENRLCTLFTSSYTLIVSFVILAQTAALEVQGSLSGAEVTCALCQEWPNDFPVMRSNKHGGCSVETLYARIFWQNSWPRPACAMARQWTDKSSCSRHVTFFYWTSMHGHGRCSELGHAVIMVLLFSCALRARCPSRMHTNPISVCNRRVKMGTLKPCSGNQNFSNLPKCSHVNDNKWMDSFASRFVQVLRSLQVLYQNKVPKMSTVHCYRFFHQNVHFPKALCV
jgi:hypothetical protein